MAAARGQAAGLAEDRAEVGGPGTLDGHRLARGAVARLDHHAEAALPEHLQLLVVVDAPERDPRPLALAADRQ